MKLTDGTWHHLSADWAALWDLEHTLEVPGGLLIHSQYVLITWRLWWHRDRWAAGRTPHWWQTVLPRRWELAKTGQMPLLFSSVLSSGRAARLQERDQSYYTLPERHTPTHMIHLNKHVHHTRNCGGLQFKNTTTNTLILQQIHNKQ